MTEHEEEAYVKEVAEAQDRRPADEPQAVEEDRMPFLGETPA